MTEQLYRSDFLVYVDGIHLPASATIIRSGRWTIPEASFEIPAHPWLSGMGRDDHVPVTIFEYDDQSPYGPRATQSFKDLTESYGDPTKTKAQGEWKLAFDGFIIGWEYTTTSTGQKMMSFQAIADLGCLTTFLLKYLVGYDDAYTVIGKRAGRAAGVPTKGKKRDWDLYFPMTLFFKDAFPPKAKVAEGVKASAKILPRDRQGRAVSRLEGAGRRANAADYVNRPFDILKNLFNSCDARHQKQYRSIIVARYFVPRIQRTRLTSRFMPAPLFEQTINPADRTNVYVGVFECLKAIGIRFKSGTFWTRLKAYESLLQQASTFGAGTPAWDFFQTLFSEMLYDILCIPNAPLFTVSDTEQRQVLSEAAPETAGADTTILANYTTIPTSFMGIPPRCNVIFPSQRVDLSYAENFVRQPTRVYVGDFHARADGLIRKKGIPFSIAYPDEAFEQLRVGRLPGKAYINNYAFLVFPEEFFAGPRAFTTGMPTWWHIMQDKVSSGKGQGKREDNTTTAEDNKEKNAGPDLTRQGDLSPKGKKKAGKGLPYKLNLDPFFFAYARYLYYIERFGQRTVQIQCNDNRNHVAGLPCLVLDREKPGMHWIGFIESLQREIRQDGRMMTMQITYVRDMVDHVDSIGELQDFKTRRRLHNTQENKNPDTSWYVYRDFAGLPVYSDAEEYFGETWSEQWPASSFASDPFERGVTDNPGLATGQPDPVPTVAFVTGIPEHASVYYGQLLWGDGPESNLVSALHGMPPADTGERSFAAPLEHIFRVVRVDKNGEERNDGIPFDPRNGSTRAQYLNENALSLPMTQLEDLYRLKYLSELQSAGFNPVALQADSMRYTWRPICNMEQYLRFMKPAWEAMYGTEMGDSFYRLELERIDDPSKNVAASYPRRLYEYAYASLSSELIKGLDQEGREEAFDQVPPGPALGVSRDLRTGKKKASIKIPAPDKVPHTRKAWQLILLAYRREVLDAIPEEW